MPPPSEPTTENGAAVKTGTNGATWHIPDRWTGYIGAHVAANLLEQHDATLNCWCVGAIRGMRTAALAGFATAPAVSQVLRIPASEDPIFRGDLTAPQFGLEAGDYDRLVHTTDSIIHCAASLNRKSEKKLFECELRGTLEVVSWRGGRITITASAGFRM